MKYLANMSDNEIIEKFQDTGYAVLDDAEDLDTYVTFTRDELADISRVARGLVGESGKSYLVAHKFQKSKGCERKTLICIDFGEIRGVYIR